MGFSGASAADEDRIALGVEEGAGGKFADFGVGRTPRVYLNSVLWLRSTLRTVARDTFKVRTISLMERCSGAPYLADQVHANLPLPGP